MREPGHWYVSYTVKSDDGSRRYARKTRTFDSEELAKLFARDIVAENLRPTADTINPYSPNTIISATDMATWLETPMQPSGSLATGQGRSGGNGAVASIPGSVVRAGEQPPPITQPGILIGNSPPPAAVADSRRATPYRGKDPAPSK